MKERKKESKTTLIHHSYCFFPSENNDFHFPFVFLFFFFFFVIKIDFHHFFYHHYSEMKFTPFFNKKTEPQDAICGNEVVEDGEECDCGWEEDCKEPCCFPMRANPPPDEPPCR